MHIRFLSVLFVLVLLSACSSQPPIFTGDFSSIPEGQEIRMQGILEKHFEKFGSYVYTLNGVWLTFDDDQFSADDFVGKTITAKSIVHHFNNCPPRQDPNIPEQCVIAEQLRVKELR